MSTPNPLDKAKAELAAAQAVVVKADNWLTAFIKNNAAKLAIAVLIAVGLVVWKLL